MLRALKNYLMWRVTWLFNVLLMIPIAVAAEPSAIHLHVDAAKMAKHAAVPQGFLHGLSNVAYQQALLDMPLLRPLRPDVWRIGYSPDFGKNYQLAKALNPEVKITLVLSDLLAMRAGGYHQLRPWRNWPRYERDVRAIVRLVRAEGYHIDYWDIWSEPDVKGFWSGSCSQVMELFKRTHHVIRAEIPDAKIVAPSISVFDTNGSCKQPFLTTFVEYAALHRLTFDAIAWHEFGEPQAVPAHVAIVRKHFAERPNLTMPEIHINEYSGPAEHALPGLAVHWLHALELASVDWASRACWEEQCQSGLNGLFKPDNRTPNPVYWVYRAYASMRSQRLDAQADFADTVALASLDNAQHALHLLVGRDASAPQDARRLNIRVKHYPYASNRLRITSTTLTNTDSPVQAVVLSANKYSVQEGVLTLQMDSIGAGHAFWLEITPLPNK